MKNNYFLHKHGSNLKATSHFRTTSLNLHTNHAYETFVTNLKEGFISAKTP